MDEFILRKENFTNFIKHITTEFVKAEFERTFPDCAEAISYDTRLWTDGELIIRIYMKRQVFVCDFIKETEDYLNKNGLHVHLHCDADVFTALPIDD